MKRGCQVTSLRSVEKGNEQAWNNNIAGGKKKMNRLQKWTKWKQQFKNLIEDLYVKITKLGLNKMR